MIFLRPHFFLLALDANTDHAQTLYEVPQDCEVVCKDCSVKQNCITSCRAKQAKCCHSVFGCCPHDARLCV